MFIENGVFLFNTSSEYHQPYFTHMKKLHPSLIKQMNCSGICHFMMFNKECLNGLFNLVSNNNNNFDFWKVFLDCVNPQESSGASEYEIYFNYMLLYKPELIKIRNLQWANLDKYSVENYDYISIHWWTRKC